MRAYDRIAQLTRCSFAPKLTSCRTLGRVWHYINRTSPLTNFSFTFVSRSLQAVARCASSRESERWGSPRRISSRRWTSRPSSASTWCVHPLEATAWRAYPRLKMNGRPARSTRRPTLRSHPTRAARSRIRLTRRSHPTHAPLASRSHPPPPTISRPPGDGQGMEQRRQARVQRRRRAALPIRRRRAAHRHHTFPAARQPHVADHPRARRRHRAEEGQGVRQQTQPLIRQLR